MAPWARGRCTLRPIKGQVIQHLSSSPERHRLRLRQPALGSVRLPKAVKADGKSLAAGTYQVRLTTQAASPDAKGQTQGLERWVEFVQGGQVKGREVVTIVPQPETKDVQKDTPPAANSSKIETLKGGDYMRLWINRGGNYYLVYFPTA